MKKHRVSKNVLLKFRNILFVKLHNIEADNLITTTFLLKQFIKRKHFW